jgi:hypothetical protein
MSGGYGEASVRRGEMTANRIEREPTIWYVVVSNLACMAILWLLSFALDFLTRRLTDHWAGSATALVVAAVVSAAIAFKLRARPATYLLAGWVATTTLELTVHLVFGIRAAQGGATHYAIGGAAMFGVIVGAFLASRGKSRGESRAPDPLVAAT